MRVDVLINERKNKSSTRVRIRKEWIIKYYPHPVLLLGPPGVGKSETVRRVADLLAEGMSCLLYTSPSPRDLSTSRMPSSA